MKDSFVFTSASEIGLCWGIFNNSSSMAVLVPFAFKVRRTSSGR